MSNEKDKIKSSNNILNDIKDFSPSIIGILTFLGVICFNILKFTEYIKAQFYFSYYGLDINLYKYFDQGFIYSLCLSIIFMLALCSLLFCIKQLMENYKGIKRLIPDNWENLLVILFSNIYIAYSYSLEKTIVNIGVVFLVNVIIEFILSCFIFKSIKYKENNLKQSLIDFLKILPFYLILLIISVGISDNLNLSLKKDYRIIEDNKVIVYSNSDYYLILDCKIEDDKLIIYRGKQNKIDTDNMYSELVKFEEVEIKEKR